MTSSALPVFVAVLALAVVAFLLRRHLLPPSRSLDAPYVRVPVLLSPAERSFYGALQQVLGGRCVVFAKVRLADLIRPRPGLSRPANRRAFNRTLGKHVDFVLCDPDRLRVVAVIELDDRSHRWKHRAARDQFVASALAAAGIPLLRIPAAAAYAPSELRARLDPWLRSSGDHPP
ncbi:MAG: DUF2726 domain-containing protein [Limisphaera sp.]